MGDIVLLLGNQAPHEVHQPSIDPDGNVVFDPRSRGELVENWGGRGPVKIHTLEPDQSPHTTVHIDPDRPLGLVLADIARLWEHHSSESPGWVVVADAGGNEHAELTRAAVAQHFGVTEPGPDVATMLVTNAGIDFIATQISGTSAATPAKYVAQTASTITPAAADTTLTGEITTASGGLIRAAGTYAHTTGASTYTVTITFTANSSDSLPVTVKAVAVFTAASTGTMVYEDNLSASITYNASGDQGVVTVTVTL